MAIVRRTSKQILEASKQEHARTDWAKIRSTTEATIRRHAREDNSETEKLGEPYYVRKTRPDTCGFREAFQKDDRINGTPVEEGKP